MQVRSHCELVQIKYPENKTNQTPEFGHFTDTIHKNKNVI